MVDCLVLGVESKQTNCPLRPTDRSGGPVSVKDTNRAGGPVQTLYQQQLRQKDIACQVGVSAATISRELDQNRQSDATQPYLAQTAQQRTRHGRQRQAYKLKGSLKEIILQRLRERCSPEQISGVVALETDRRIISHETIYRYYYGHNDANGQPLSQFLRIRHKKRYKKRGKPQKRRTFPHRVGIEQRPAIVETNTQLGHWEGATVIGAEHDGVLLTLVERVTK